MMPSIYNDPLITSFALRPAIYYDGRPYFDRQICTQEDIKNGYKIVTQIKLEDLPSFKKQFLQQFDYLSLVSIHFKEKINTFFPNIKSNFLSFMPSEVLIEGSSTENSLKNEESTKETIGNLIGDITIYGVDEYIINLQLFYNSEKWKCKKDPLLLWWKCKIEFLPKSILAPFIKKFEEMDSDTIEVLSEQYGPSRERALYFKWLSNIVLCKNNFTIPKITFKKDWSNKFTNKLTILPLLLKIIPFNSSTLSTPNCEVLYGSIETIFPAAPFLKQVKHTINITNPLEFISLFCLNYYCSNQNKKWLTLDMIKIVNIILEKNKPIMSPENIKNEMKKYDSIRIEEYEKIKNSAYANQETLKDAKKKLNVLELSQAYYELQKKLPPTQIEVKENSIILKTFTIFKQNMMLIIISFFSLVGLYSSIYLCFTVLK
jgi:hypothetical protein